MVKTSFRLCPIQLGSFRPQLLHLLLASTLLLTACEPSTTVPLPPADLHTLRIVSSLPTKGQSAHETKLMREAIDMAVAEHERQLPAWMVEHISLDDGDSETGDWSRDKEGANAQAAADDPATVAYIGPYNSGAAMVSMPMLNRTGLLQMLPSETWPGLTQEGWAVSEPQRYFPSGRHTAVRMMPPDSSMPEAAVEWSRLRGARTALVVDDGSDYSKGMAQVFSHAATSRLIGATTRLSLEDPALETEAAGPTQPDAIFFAPSSLSSVRKLIVALGKQTHKAGVFVTDVALSDQLTSLERESMQGWHILFNDDPRLKASAPYLSFVRRFQARYGHEPSRFAANAYDLATLALDAAQTAGRDRRSIIDAVLNDSKQEGVTGPARFTPSGDIIGRRVTSYHVQDGTFQLEDLPAFIP